jgi:hypothetical protein
MKNAFCICYENVKRPLEHLNVDCKIILIWTLNKWDTMMYAGLILIRRGFSVGFVNVGFHIKR